MLEASVSASTGPRRSLADLAALDVGALVRLYRECEAPRSLGALARATDGKLLALSPIVDRARSLVVPLAFPWLGKRIDLASEHEGHGLNRFRWIGDRVPFDVRYGRSALDSERCVVFDYDRQDNPEPIRRVHDELREAAPGIFFGPALVRTATEPKLLLFFAMGA